MCGIVGFWQFGANAKVESCQHVIRTMSELIKSRGPDGYGDFIDEKNHFAMAHRRLAIIDLSSHANQPMVSDDGSMVICYNGEIYNYKKIKSKLQRRGKRFKTTSDTEVLLEACAYWGVEKTVDMLIGMFAFAVWDTRKHTLTLVRDRLGIKPLYWSRQGDNFLFASQSKCFTKFPPFNKKIDINSLSCFLRLGYILQPLSIYQDCYQLEPGHILTIAGNGSIKKKRYWNISELAEKNSGLDEDKAIIRLEELLRDAVQKRMLADVQVGAFLSGGVDSSLVAALMQTCSSDKVKTFSVGFKQKQFDESNYAAKIAEHLGTDHTTIMVDAKDALGVLDDVVLEYDEPFADSSQLPTMLISKLIREHVTVALSGDGGDEVFAGYNRYIMADKLKRLFMSVPLFLRSSAAQLISIVPPYIWDSILPNKFLSGDKLHKFASVLQLAEFTDIYPHLISQWPDKNNPVLGCNNAFVDTKKLLDNVVAVNGVENVRQMQLVDILSYLPGDILTKVDRASMAYSLEARVPLLDHRVVEFAFSLPLDMLLDSKGSKKILRKILYKYVPSKLMERPKQGFAVPLGSWLRTDLKVWADNLLTQDFLHEYFAMDIVNKKWQEHLSGSRNWHYAIWNVLIFSLWYKNWM